MARKNSTSATTSAPSTDLTCEDLAQSFKAGDEKILDEVFNYDRTPMRDEAIDNFVPRPAKPVFPDLGDAKCEPLDLSMPVCSRRGWPAVIFEADLALNKLNAFPLKAVIFTDRQTVNSTWSTKGQYVTSELPHNNDLFNVPRSDWKKLVTDVGYLVGPSS